MTSRSATNTVAGMIMYNAPQNVKTLWVGLKVTFVRLLIILAGKTLKSVDLRKLLKMSLDLVDIIMVEMSGFFNVAGNLK